MLRNRYVRPVIQTSPAGGIVARKSQIDVSGGLSAAMDVGSLLARVKRRFAI